MVIAANIHLVTAKETNSYDHANMADAGRSVRARLIVPMWVSCEPDTKL
jgi:hypothetical protein